MFLITGVSGFIGKHLLKSLVKQYGARKVVALTSEPVSECPYLIHNNYSFPDDYFVNSGYSAIHTIIHAGAFTPKESKQSNDIEKCNRNIYTTEILLRANLPALSQFVFLSTLDVYGKTDIIKESSLIEPISLYGLSKLYCEKMVEAWAVSSGKRCQILRIGHVYGPGEEAYQKVIPVTIKKLLNNEPIQIWGDGNEIRSFIYIQDVVQAILNAIDLDKGEGVINLVGDQQIKIKDIVDLLIKISGRKAQIEFLTTSVPGRDLIFDSEKMKRLLLQKTIPFEEGILQEWQYAKELFS